MLKKNCRYKKKREVYAKNLRNSQTVKNVLIVYVNDSRKKNVQYVIRSAFSTSLITFREFILSAEFKLRLLLRTCIFFSSINIASRLAGSSGLDLLSQIECCGNHIVLHCARRFADETLTSAAVITQYPHFSPVTLERIQILLLRLFIPKKKIKIKMQTPLFHKIIRFYCIIVSFSQVH